MEARLEVRDLGPVVEGRLRIRPLTVFIGPNNTGKSHMAMLYYALLQTVMVGRDRLRLLVLRSMLLKRREGKGEELERFLAELLKWNIERVFSSGIPSLVKWGSQKMEVRACIGKGGSAAHFSLLAELGRDPDMEVRLRGNILRNLLALEVHYLPASRAGLLQNYRAMVSALIRQIPYALLKGGLEVPEIPGVVADFLRELVETAPRRFEGRAQSSIAEFFEREIIEGELELEFKEVGVPELSYRVGERTLPLYRMSSMLVELAPLGIYLKYGVVGRGDTLIIEESESHLHPDKQVRVAELLSMLVNSGVNVLVTTHSEILLAKLSNLVSLGALPEEEAAAMGPAIRPDKVAVYSFRRDAEGVVVEEVEVTEEGIPDDVFSRIVEELYEENMNLYYRVRQRA